MRVESSGARSPHMPRQLINFSARPCCSRAGNQMLGLCMAAAWPARACLTECDSGYRIGEPIRPLVSRGRVRFLVVPRNSPIWSTPHLPPLSLFLFVFPPSVQSARDVLDGMRRRDGWATAAHRTVLRGGSARVDRRTVHDSGDGLPS